MSCSPGLIPSTERVAHARGHLVLEGGHPDLVELVEQLGEDGEELGALQQGLAVVLGQIEQAGAEVEAGLLAIGEPLRAEGLDLLVGRRYRAPRAVRRRLDVVGLALGLCHGLARRRVDGTCDPTPTTTIRPVPPGRRRATIPRYQFGPKPRRRTELGLLLFGSALVVALYVIAELGR